MTNLSENTKGIILSLATGCKAFAFNTKPGVGTVHDLLKDLEYIGFDTLDIRVGQLTREDFFNGYLTQYIKYSYDKDTVALVLNDIPESYLSFVDEFIMDAIMKDSNVIIVKVMIK